MEILVSSDVRGFVVGCGRGGRTFRIGPKADPGSRGATTAAMTCQALGMIGLHHDCGVTTKSSIIHLQLAKLAAPSEYMRVKMTTS